MKYYKKIIVIFFLISIGVLTNGCYSKSRTKSYKGSFFSSTISDINFTDEWNKLKKEIELDYDDKDCTIEKFLITTSRDKKYIIDKIFISWKEKKNETILTSQLNIYPREEKIRLYQREFDSDQEVKSIYQGVTIEKVVKIVDEINLDDMISMTYTEGEFYNIELFGVLVEGNEVFEKYEQGEFTGKTEVDEETGKEYKDYYHHKFVINNNGELKVLHSDERYLLNSRGVKLVIVPMEKVKEGHFRGGIEVEVINLLSN